MDKVYPINGLFFYRLIFMAILILGESFYCYKLERKPRFPLRCSLGIISCFLVALAFPIPTNNDFYSMMMFFFFFAYTYLIACLLFKTDKKMILFCLLCGYTTEHIAYELYNSLSSFIIASDFKPGGLYNYDEISLFANGLDFCLWIVSYINVYWLMFVIFARRIVKGKVFENVGSVKTLAIGSFFIFVDIVLNSLTSFYSSIHYERIYIGLISIINVITCIVGMSFIFEIYYSGNLKRENMIINQIREEEKHQYLISKETIDLINIKCHDFRHQIRQLGKEQNINEEAIQNINKLIQIYDSSVKTSNEALNVILSEKSLMCNKYEIRFSCIANGEVLNFISEEDIYSLFGNILDNAIQAVKCLEKEKRRILLKIKTVGNIVSISCQNPYSQKIELVNGLPKTTKGSITEHGFGLKSIKLIAEKYNGTMNLSYDDNVFSITLMFIKDKKDQSDKK